MARKMHIETLISRSQYQTTKERRNMILSRESFELLNRIRCTLADAEEWTEDTNKQVARASSPLIHANIILIKLMDQIKKDNPDYEKDVFSG